MVSDYSFDILKMFFYLSTIKKDRRGRDHILVGFTTTYEFEFALWQGARETTLYDKVYQ